MGGRAAFSGKHHVRNMPKSVKKEEGSKIVSESTTSIRDSSIVVLNNNI